MKMSNFAIPELMHDIYYQQEKIFRFRCIFRFSLASCSASAGLCRYGVVRTWLRLCAVGIGP